MQLVSAKIKNFRSLKNVIVEFGQHTAFIGGNGAGKSSILKALEKFYSTARVLDADDYFGRNQSEPVEIELTFGSLSQQEAEAFASRVRDGKLVVTRVFDTSVGSGRYFGSVMQNPDFSSVRSQVAANPKRDAYRELRTNNPAYSDLPTAPSAAAVDEELRAWEEQNPDKLVLEKDDGQFFGFQNASRGALQRHTTFVFIPAVRDASVDAADGKASAIGKLLELLVRSSILQRQDIRDFQEDMTARYKNLVSPENMPELGELATTLTNDLKGLYGEAAVGLTWRDTGEVPVPLPAAEVTLSDDGFDAQVDRQGHGLQRAFVFTLLQHLARTSVPSGPEAAPQSEKIEGEKEPIAQEPSLILAIEEPELYQHPTKQRHFANVLRSLSNGTLPGTKGNTQIAFASHSPMFVSLGHAHEIRLVRRVDCDEGDYKQCSLIGLDLEVVAKRLEVAKQAKAGSYSAASLTPKLHILGNELAEGFFASGIVLVEGRSDVAALVAAARLKNVDFAAAGIAVLSAEGKTNLDRPLLIFKELGIPTYIIWDCDTGTKDCKPEQNLFLLRSAQPDADVQVAPTQTIVGPNFAHFEVDLEHVLETELTPAVYNACLNAACKPYDLAPGKDAQKIPEIMYRTLAGASETGAECQTLKNIVSAIWLHLRGEALPT